MMEIPIERCTREVFGSRVRTTRIPEEVQKRRRKFKGRPRNGQAAAQSRCRILSAMAEKQTMTGKTQIHDSSGNVFADLRIANSEQYLAKSELAAKILNIVERQGLTQAATGQLLGINQPKVSALLNGRLDGFSTDRLFRFLNALGCDVRITVSRPRPRTRGRVRVLAG
jgi:predicted XRE-type DNA-binding protein